MLRSKNTMIRDTPSTYRSIYQPLFGKGARAPPPTGRRPDTRKRTLSSEMNSVPYVTFLRREIDP